VQIFNVPEFRQVYYLESKSSFSYWLIQRCPQTLLLELFWPFSCHNSPIAHLCTLLNAFFSSYHELVHIFSLCNKFNFLLVFFMIICVVSVLVKARYTIHSSKFHIISLLKIKPLWVTFHPNFISLQLVYFAHTVDRDIFSVFILRNKTITKVHKDTHTHSIT